MKSIFCAQVGRRSIFKRSCVMTGSSGAFLIDDYDDDDDDDDDGLADFLLSILLHASFYTTKRSGNTMEIFFQPTAKR